MGRKVACLCVLLTVAMLPMPAVAAAELSVNSSMLLVGTFPPSGTGSPNPYITYLVGASVPLSFGILYLEPMLELFGSNYEWVDAAGVAVPADIDRAAGFFTLGTLVSLQVGVNVPLFPALSLGASVGADFLLRFPLEFFNPLPESVAGRDPALAYFFAAGRFFYPESRIFLRWKTSDTIMLVMSLRAFYPIFHLWDGTGQPFWDQFMVSGGVGFAIKLGAAPKAAAPQAAPQPAPQPAPAAPEAAPAPDTPPQG